jgi:superfamily II DNA or RNA helicase
MEDSSMALASKLAFYFEKRVQFKGIGLFQGRHVDIAGHSPVFFEGIVHGGSDYDVALRYRERDHLLVISCTCPYFQDMGECKHLWAAVLEADRTGALGVAAADPRLSLEEDYSGEMPKLSAILPRLAMVPQPPPVPAWEEHLTAIRQGLERKKPPPSWPRDFEILYTIDIPGSKSGGTIIVELLSRTRKKNGEWGAVKDFRVTASQTGLLPDPADAEAITLMLGGQDSYLYSHDAVYGSTRKALPPPLALRLMPIISATGRLYARTGGAYEPHPVAWDGGEPWRLNLEVRQDDRDQWTITGSFRRGEARMELNEPLLLRESGFLLAQDRLSRFDAAGGFAWIDQLRRVKRIPFPDREREKVLGNLLSLAVVPPLELDEPLQFEQREAQPRLGMKIAQHKNSWNEEYFEGRLILDYGRGWMEDTGAARGIWLPEERVYVLRDQAAEAAARQTVEAQGLKPLDGRAGSWRMPPRVMPRVVRELLHAGWHVEAEGKAFRRPGATRVDVASGIDWFELRGEVDYDGATATLPQLLAALRRGETMVRLGDGTFGLLPEEWLARFAPLAGLGATEDDHLRFRRNQAGLLDALLAAQPEVRVDEVFARVREKMLRFQGVAPLPQPEGFVGRLRDYQCEGLGWMQFLREFGFGGCLADDMGVGKTAQVLATLEARRAEGKGPSLVVAPKSLMFNWRGEAAKFTPQLRVLEHTGLDRDIGEIRAHDLVLTTYGTLIRDAAQLAELEFDYVVLDEAQAVKNANTASAKAVRLLRGAHRLALSGTPVENHLGELWSLFEFLNPGMLGEAKVLKMAGGLARNPGEESRRLLAHALRPFILRRTKQQVARELPEKTEQTIFCELDAAQRKQYDELRRHYRETLLRRVAAGGINKAKMHVLEALLRLRQAACHPGLLDVKRSGEPSAKLDVLLDQLDELRDEGHKALVFSQFTSLLAIVRARLDEAGVRYEYLDGATRDRQARVESFQNDPAIALFLISLKAGGLGLNLTAAEYVFLLDPWWNPAVEAQAVDRTHRIGQTRPVFAYRLIARDTVEEKVLELQKTKRDLADAILGEDNSLIRDLKKEDLELLLS